MLCDVGNRKLTFHRTSSVGLVCAVVRRRAPKPQITNGVLPVKIVPWETGVAVEPNDNFAHPRYTSFSLGTDASWRAALQVAALRDSVRESSGRGVP